MEIAWTGSRPRRGLGDRLGDGALRTLTAAAAGAAVALVGAIAYEIFRGSSLSFSAFGFGFLTHTVWDPVKRSFGALDLIGGTLVSSFVALLIAAPVAVAIALFLTQLAPPWVRGPVGTLVELLAAIPSVVLGFWGIFVLGPFVQDRLEPFLHSTLGFLPFFRGTPSASGMLPAALILAIMATPIIASVCRELFLRVPDELEEGARALGATRWETVRGVVLHSTRGGIAAACLLGFGRAVGEAIAVSMTIGAALGIHLSLFAQGNSLGARIASEYQSASDSRLHLSSLVYLGAILLVIGVLTSLTAQLIVRRFEAAR